MNAFTELQRSFFKGPSRSCFKVRADASPAFGLIDIHKNVYVHAMGGVSSSHSAHFFRQLLNEREQMATARPLFDTFISVARP